MNTEYREFFKVVTGGEHEPYPYQERLAGSNEGRSQCESLLIDIPTGMGKTAAVTIAWLWNRVVLQNSNWPRRLVYCLPMRTLVEQTQDEVVKWLEAAWQIYPSDEIKWLKENSPVVLMGGEKQEKQQAEWDLYPEKETILIGTQDMLLSRALNRGYGMSRFRWPMHFGLLNNDCLWVLDETQLMGVGIETSSQLEGLRRVEKLGSVAPCQTWWMSATLGEAQLKTVDHQVGETGLSRCELSDSEKTSEEVRKKLEAEKRVHRLPVALGNTTQGDLKDYAVAVASLLVELHQEGLLTLAVLNRVDRAQAVYTELKKLGVAAEVALIHSRFRPGDRAEHHKVLEKREGDRIVIATQAIEAGVDVSARILVTELAPWSSLVQRFGRCHRYGEIAVGADVHWIDLHSTDPKKAEAVALPYGPEELELARAAMQNLDSANPNRLAEIDIVSPKIVRPVIRRKDLVDLADTTADLAGNDLDVSRYVRDGEDRDVQIFWRKTEEEGLTVESQKSPTRDELCRVSLYTFSKFYDNNKSKRRIWRWNPLDDKWQIDGRPVPNQVYLIDVDLGGYSADLGWTGKSKDKLQALPGDCEAPQAYGGDRLSDLGVWLTLEEHTQNVRRHLGHILRGITLQEGFAKALETAALWHDVGKAHAVFQNATGAEGYRAGKVWAKAARMVRYERPLFRHELASALMWLQAQGVSHDSTGSTDRSNPLESSIKPSSIGEREMNLIAFLIAAHHGKVRFSIRALPGEDKPKNEDTLFARGVWNGDLVPREHSPGIELEGLSLSPVELDLSFMQLGAGSWLGRMIGLLESPELGPFRLGYLETLLRSADMRASAEEAI